MDTNLSAIAANNALNSTDAQMTKAITELSTGLSIQTAADGPAAYVQSQALQSQANGYQVAISNAQDGVSLVQTASGALNQISSILQTMNQLALSSANGATQDPTSLQANQQEFSALQNDINQIASTTSYGTTNLLDGTFTQQTLQVGAFDVSTQQITLSIASADATSLGVGNNVTTAVSSVATTAAITTSGASTVTVGSGGEAFQVTNGNMAVTVSLSAGTYTESQLTNAVNQQLSAIGVAATFGTGSTASGGNGATQGALALYSSTAGSAGISVSEQYGSSNGNWFGAVSGTPGTGTTQPISSLDLSVGVGSSTSAQQAISAVQNAISMVDSIEANVGAVQNELQAIAANLTVGQQNLTAAHSQLVDVNMAQEMTTFSTDQILMQTGTSMLAQAQQAPQLILKLI
ncbi:MAG: flagellin [Actinomycetota bacterium]|nr:flagellin [Actinomycetota bacterium]